MLSTLKTFSSLIIHPEEASFTCYNTLLQSSLSLNHSFDPPNTVMSQLCILRVTSRVLANLIVSEATTPRLWATDGYDALAILSRIGTTTFAVVRSQSTALSASQSAVGECLAWMACFVAAFETFPILAFVNKLQVVDGLALSNRRSCARRAN